MEFIHRDLERSIERQDFTGVTEMKEEMQGQKVLTKAKEELSHYINMVESEREVMLDGLANLDGYICD